ncbi:unnamed protein product [Clavelina lepadiformis]|uniref:Uncharacterized protein n=1 Tax=Clavelina lepadiformis TaxID=159417 RepID=A0ABP0FDF8_CLALP
MTADMAFERKWVSESNLDKLWNETIEKKEANKQRRSPDFCKQAILCATLKRISSEMIMRRLSEPMLDIDLNPEEGVTVLSNVTMKIDCDNDDLTFDTSMSLSCDKDRNEKIYTELVTSNESKALFSTDTESFESIENSICNFSDSDSNVSMDMGKMTNPGTESPKRKRNELDEDDVSVSANLGNCSPAKRQRYKNSKPDSSSSSKRNRKRSQSPARKLNNVEKLRVPRIKIENVDDNSNKQKGYANGALLSPVKSVVNSISELSLGVKETWQSSSNGSWCLDEPPHNDPLELDGFFHKLKKVTS